MLSIDNNNPQSYAGQPTTNIIPNMGLGTYNNVPGDVTASLATNGTYYR